MPPRQDLGRHLFSFAVISDSHVNEGEDRSVSPYACNRLANARLREVVRQVNRHRPALTVHLGDMGNPLPELPSYGQAAAQFAAITAELRSPLHLVAGNHCVGDKPTGWVPVPRVSARSLSQYRQTYGRHYYSFAHGPCHFVALSSLIINSGLPEESDQRRWVEEDLAMARRAGQRLWLLMHYPPYVTDPAELGSYDNVDEPGRSWLLDLLERYDVEAVFTGHVHNYFYNRYAGADLYTVPATSFVRQDYSELFCVAPADEEGGRNDLAKLGFCLVEVHERGHVTRVVRTFGRVLAEGAHRAASAPPPAGEPDAAPFRPWGAEMRESWLSKAALRTNNSVSPFTSRWARNDWAVLALREMGISRVRMSLLELSKEDVIERMSTLQEAGFEFLVYCHGAPGEREYRLVRKHRALVAGWELILGLDQIASTAHRIAEICGRPRQPGGLPCYLNEIRDISQAQIDDANVKHEANYGFQPAEGPRLAEIVGRDLVRETFTGLVFRLHRRGMLRATPWSAIQEIGDLGRASGMRHQVHLLFSGNLTAERLVDDLDGANRVAESALAAVLAGNVDLYFDTFEDVDRGYFVRHGLVDRRYNPRLAARVLQHLRAEVARPGGGRAGGWSARDSGGCRWLTARFDRRRWILILPGAACTVQDIAAAGEIAGNTLRSLDLDSGELRDLRFAAVGSRLELERPLAVSSPVLLIAEAGVPAA